MKYIDKEQLGNIVIQKREKIKKWKSTAVADVHKPVDILQRLADGGKTIIIIEHYLDVIKTADYYIDIGPEGGDKGGTVIA